MADDIAQQALLTALERPETRVSHPRAWLATITRSILRRMRRAAERRLRHETCAPPLRGEAAASEVVARANLQRAVVEAVLALDEPYRATMLLRWFEELAPREVAERLEVPLETVRTRLKRGLVMLRVRLEETLGGDGAWILALLPVAEIPPGAFIPQVPPPLRGTPATSGTPVAATGATATVAGALVMATKLKIAVAAIVLVVVAPSLRGISFRRAPFCKGRRSCFRHETGGSGRDGDGPRRRDRARRVLVQRSATSD
jgi:RNA polymerase sigma-70 factor (ECF subfamily)